MLDGIEAARGAFERVELDALIQCQNQHEIPAIFDYALDRRLAVWFIELVDTDFNAPGHRDGVLADALVALL